LQGKQEELEDFVSLPAFTEDEDIKKLQQMENAPIHEAILELYSKLEEKEKLDEVFKILKKNNVKNRGNNIPSQIRDLEYAQQLKLLSQLQKLDKNVPQDGLLGLLNYLMK
jgi:hypothetical protein